MLTTDPRDHAAVREIAGVQGRLLWRVQVRRGLTEVRREKVSAAAVIGVTFDAQPLQDQLSAVALGAKPSLVR